MRSRYVSCHVSLDTIRANAEGIRRRTGVALLAVVKSDGYGLGAVRVCDALASVADDFAFFNLEEAAQAGQTGLILGPPDGEAARYRELGARPSVFTIEDARRLSGLRAAVAVDTGMQRFGCDPQVAETLVRLADAAELMTHAGRDDAASTLTALRGSRSLRLHAACSGMLDNEEAWLDAVRPGVALYRGALRVSTKLVEARDARGPAGYTSFQVERLGVILAGYSHGLGPAPVLVNGRPQRLLEVGMNTSFVSLGRGDCVGDEVVLLGDGVSEQQVAAALGIREHEVLCRYGCAGIRQYDGRPSSIVTEHAAAFSGGV